MSSIPGTEPQIEPHINKPIQTQEEAFEALTKKLADSEARVRSRDFYLNQTILDTSKLMHKLNQKVTDLEEERDDVKRDCEGLRSKLLQFNEDGASEVSAETAVLHMTEEEQKEEDVVQSWLLAARSEPDKDPSRIYSLNETVLRLLEDQEGLDSGLALLKMQVEAMDESEPSLSALYC